MNIAALVFTVLFASVAAAYVVSVYVDARMEAKNAPRTPMFLCPKHGAIPDHLCVTFDENQSVGSTREKHCPMCLEDAFKIAETTMMKKERIRV